MSIVIHSEAGTRLLSPASYLNESELQNLLEMAPALLQADCDTGVAFVERQVDLPDAGTLDLLFVTADGLPIAVKVNLARNAKARREVLAEAIDHLASLKELMVWELDEKVHGNLKGALQKWSKAGSPDDFERRWRALARNLRAGLARLVVVFDEAPEDLERLFQYAAANSKLEVYLMIVQRFKDDRCGEVLVPRFVVTPTSENRPGRIVASSGFLKVLDTYNAKATPDLQTVGRAATWRQIRPPTWPYKEVHYEIGEEDQQIGVQLHLESDAARPLADVLRPFAGKPVADGAGKLEWDQTWMANRGRLAAWFPLETDPEIVASAMRDLIRLTHEPVRNRLQTL